MKILITGSSGMVGSELVLWCQSKDIELLRLVSSGKKGPNIIRWSVDKGIIDPIPYTEIDIVVHLAGESIASKSWSQDQKNRILKSRVLPLQLLYKGFKDSNHWPKKIISASGTGIYPAFENKTYNEDSDAGNNFLSDVCIEWEKAANEFSSNSQVYVHRFGVVLGKKGFLKEILAPAKFYLGAVPGSGKQYVPWIHIQDLVKVLTDSIDGKLEPNTYNVVAPELANMQTITMKAILAIRKKLVLPNLPVFLVKLLFGERSLLLLSSQKVVPNNLQKSNFKFNYPTLDSALENLFDTK